MIFNLFGINALNKKLKELEDKNHAQYCENNRLKKELEAGKLDLKIAQMYIDDDDALLELLEMGKPKLDPVYQTRAAALGAGYGQASQQALMAQYNAQQAQRNQQNNPMAFGSLGSLNVWSGI